MSCVIDFDAFDKKVDFEELRALSKKSRKGCFSKVVPGEYLVKIDSMFLEKSKSGNNMLKVKFKIIKGDFEGHDIYMFQVVENRLQIDACNLFLRSLSTSQNILFSNYSQYGEVIKGVWYGTREKIFKLSYGRTSTGYDTFKIIDYYNIF